MKKFIYRTIIIITVILSIIIYKFSVNYKIAFDNYIAYELNASVTHKINRALINEISNSKVRYEDIATILNNEDGTPATIRLDTVTINNIALSYSELILDSIKLSDRDFGVPLGSLSGSYLFSGKGPDVTVQIIPLGTVDYDIRSELLSSGINQTLHRISIMFSGNISCAIPFADCKSGIRAEIILTETIIVGKVPEIILSPSG